MAKFGANKEGDELLDLIKLYKKLKSGTSGIFIDEDDFHIVIDYFDDERDLEAALQAAETALTYFPYMSDFHIRKADYLVQLKNNIEAQKAIDVVLLITEQDVDIYLIQAEIFLQQSEYEKAYNTIRKGLEIAHDAVEKVTYLFDATDLYDDYDQFQEVFSLLQLILEINPDNEEALHKICFWADINGLNEESIFFHQKILEDNPFNILAWFNVAVAYQSLKMYEKALDSYQNVIDLDEKFDYAYRNMGDAYIRLKKYDKAIEILEKVLELAPHEEVIFEAIGFCYEKLHQYQHSRQYYKKAAYLSPEDSRLIFKIGKTYLAQNFISESINYFKRAIKICPYAEYYLLLAQAYQKDDNTEEAYWAYRSAIRMKPRVTKYWVPFLRLAYEDVDNNAMLDLVLSAINLVGNKTIFNYYLFVAYMKKGNKTTALNHLENGLSQNTKHWKAINEWLPNLINDQAVLNLVNRYF